MLQNRSRQRKVIYALTIVGLLFVMLLHRPYAQEAAAEANVQVTNLGEVDLGGSISRFVLTSFRGPLICGLWWEAREAQAKHEYERMELVTTALTKLQPHYKGPWRYEAWNMAYNVAVEFDRIADKYFYLAKGLRRLVEGERKNRATLYDPAARVLRSIGDPDMREEIGMYTQNKFSYADEAEIYRILLQISCIPPERRDLNELANNPQAMREFKAAYPILTRRIRSFRYVAEEATEMLDREILSLLREYQDNPGLYPTPAERARQQTKPENEFPFWPEDAAGGWEKPANPGIEELQDCFDIAHRWYLFSIEPLPATAKEIEEGNIKMSQALARNTTTKMSLIFRANPARAKCLQAQQLAKEGWGTAAQKCWELGYALWLRFGTQNGLELGDADFAELTAKARIYEERFPNLARDQKPPPTYLQERIDEYRQLSEGYAAFLKLRGLSGQRTTANYDYWRVASEFNRTDNYRDARQLWYLAGQRRSNLALALNLYDSSMENWRKLLVMEGLLPIDFQISHSMAALFTPGMGVIAALAPLKAARPTPYGMHTQVQENVMHLNEEYLQTYSISRAPSLIQSVVAGTEAVSLVARQVGSPAGQYGVVGALPLGLTPWSIEEIEDVIQLGDGPFSQYVSGQVRENFHARDREVRQRILGASQQEGLPPRGGPPVPNPDRR